MSNTSDNNYNPLKTPSLRGVLNYGVIPVKSDKNLEDLQDVDIEMIEREDYNIIYFDKNTQSWKRSSFV